MSQRTATPGPTTEERLQALEDRVANQENWITALRAQRDQEHAELWTLRGTLAFAFGTLETALTRTDRVLDGELEAI